MAERSKLNTPLAREAEATRQAVDGVPVNPTVKVKVGDQAVSFAGSVHKPGSTFTAPAHAVRDAVARKLLTQVEAKK